MTKNIRRIEPTHENSCGCHHMWEPIFRVKSGLEIKIPSAEKIKCVDCGKESVGYFNLITGLVWEDENAKP